MLKKRSIMIITLWAVLLILSACAGVAPIDQTATAQADGGQGETTGGEGEGADAGADLEGDVIIDGSSTVYPITTAVAEEFAGIYPDVRVSVGLSGTGGGF